MGLEEFLLLLLQHLERLLGSVLLVELLLLRYYRPLSKLLLLLWLGKLFLRSKLLLLLLRSELMLLLCGEEVCGQRINLAILIIIPGESL